MMDYPAWRKKTPTPQFISYSNANRIEQLILEEKPSTSAAAAAAAVAQSHKTSPTESAVSSSNTTTATTTGTTGVQLETDNSTLKTVRSRQIHLLKILYYIEFVLAISKTHLFSLRYRTHNLNCQQSLAALQQQQLQLHHQQHQVPVEVAQQHQQGLQ